jgi:bifunctional non-homologous end joining protein LigD
MPAKKKKRAAQDVHTSTRRQTPDFVTPMAAVSVDALPEGPEWSYELKLDGYRALIIKDGASVRVRSRNDKDLSQMYPSVLAAGLRLQVEQAVIDGEIVALDKEGRPSFQALQHRGTHPAHTIAFYAFDLLNINGKDTRAMPLEERRAKLARVIDKSGLLLSVVLPGTVSDIVATVRRMQLEGVIAKRISSQYEAGERSGNWRKLKLQRQQEFVVGGYRPSGEGSVDALLVGYFENRELRFAAKVRAGLVPHVRRQLARTLAELRQKQCPFVDLPSEGSSRWGGGVSAEDMKEMVWTKPDLVVQIQFVEWTAENRLRHSRFLGLRSDKAATDVGREK